jgi:hypothetical protein
VPKNDPTRMTKMAEMRTPMRPSKSLSVGQSDMIALSRVVLARGPDLPMTKDGKVEVEVKLTARQGRQRIFARAWCLVLLPTSQQYDECSKTRFQCAMARGSWSGRWLGYEMGEGRSLLLARTQRLRLTIKVLECWKSGRRAIGSCAIAEGGQHRPACHRRRCWSMCSSREQSVRVAVD